MRKKEKWTNKDKDKDEAGFAFTQYKSYPMFIPNFKIVGEVVAEKYVQKILFEKKKSGQIKGMINMRMLNLSYTIEVVIPSVCTKFQNPKCSSS